jgi:hypothetical protein
MPAFHTQVNLAGFPFPDFQLTVALASGITTSDVGKAMAIDTSGANKFKLAGAGDIIVGRLLTVENRVNEGQLVGTIAFKFAEKLPIKAGLAGANVIVLGSTAVGAGSGEIQARTVTGVATPDYTDNMVVAIDGLFATVLKF